jgi:hypothetical protein
MAAQPLDSAPKQGMGFYQQRALVEWQILCFHLRKLSIS